MTASLYRVALADRLGQEHAEVPARGLNYERRLGGMGAASFSIAIEHPSISGNNRDLLDTWATEVNIYRADVPVYSGPVTALSASADGDSVQVGCQAAPIWLGEREVRDDLTYNNVDQAAIYAALVNYAQSAVFKGSAAAARVLVQAPATGVSLSLKFFAADRKNILDALASLTDASNGFDVTLVLGLDPATGYVKRTLTTAYPTSGFLIAQPLRLGKSGLQSLTVKVAGDKVATRISLLGASQGASQVRTSVNIPTVENRYGRHEATLSLTTATTTGELLRAGFEYARLHAPPIKVYGASYRVCDSTPYRFVNLGDQVRVQADRGWVLVDQLCRTVAEKITVADDGSAEVVDLTFNDPVG